jgi:uncharacterized protein YmfQ (DUF2313 family)
MVPLGNAGSEFDAMSDHATLLAASLPPVSYSLNAPVLSGELAAEGKALDAALASARIVLEAIFPNAGPLLEDWERVYGTPSPCSEAIGLTRNQRVALVKIKMNEGGTFNIKKAIEVAALLGYSIQIKEHRARDYKRSTYGGFYGGREWNFVWDVITTNNTVTPRRYRDAYGERYRRWGNAILECLLKPKVMSGTLVRFIYLT